MRVRVIAVAAICCAVSAAGFESGCTTPAESPTPTPTPGVAPTPPVAGVIPGIDLFDGWTDPENLPAPVNTSGWEDSPFISKDGTTLYFGYTRFDYDALTHGTLSITGPHRPGEHGDAFDIYEATITGNSWSVVDSTVNDATDISEAAQGVDQAGTTMVFIRFDSQGKGDMYLAHKSGSTWGSIELLPAPVSTACTEDNPTLSEDGNTIYFDSDREDPAGTTCSPTGVRTIFSTHRSGNGWSTPEALPGAPNQQGTFHWQVYEDDGGNSIYWSGADPTICPTSCLIKSTLSGGTYVNPTVIARATGTSSGAIALGEMSITGDGRYLYFVYINALNTTSHDLSLGVARRAP